MADPSRLWSPTADQMAASQLRAFADRAQERTGRSLPDYEALWRWSVEDLDGFWAAVWEFAQIQAAVPYTSVLADRSMPGARWFEGSRLNYAQNLLRHARDRPNHPALIEVSEGGEERVLTYGELADAAARFAAFLRHRGVQRGDRVAALLPNRIEAVVAMLGTASIGAIWSSCSPDFGHQGVLDRFGQIEPTVLIAADGTANQGARISLIDRVERLRAELPSVRELVLVPVIGEEPAGRIAGSLTPWAQAVANPAPPVYEPLPFDHPLFILYSSGTTGVPKCIVHGHGGTLLEHAKEHLLQGDLQPDDVLFYFTTTGWMMWNWLVSGLLTGCAVVLYDGSPLHPDVGALWRMAERHRLTHFGTSPKFLSACAKAEYHPSEHAGLPDLRVLYSTGAPLSAELFGWACAQVKPDLQVASISGGTDILGCFFGPSPIDPVYAGELQRRGLGMAVEAWSPVGEPVVGDKGELVVTAPFPSMPVGFWRDEDGQKYRAAYFDSFPGVWRHGDYIEITERGGAIVHGRSDATLNPGGVRIGTAEIYRVVEALDEVVDSVVVGQRWEDDSRVVLFVVLREGLSLTAALKRQIKGAIRSATTPHHVPALVIEAPAIPRTLSGKKVELAVANMLHGEPVTNRAALANPEALAFFATALD